MKVEIHAKVFGNVQGVGMRATVRMIGLKMGLQGTVRNCNDGSVEIVAQGPKEQLEKFITQLKTHFSIERIAVQFHSLTKPLKGFLIL